MKRFLLAAMIAFFAFSCTLEITEQDQELKNGPVKIERVCMTAPDFICEESGTKTTIDISSGVKFYWATDDVVGVFPNIEGASQVKFPIQDGSVDGGTNTSEANFTGNGWAVMKSKDYSAYYPFRPEMDLDMTSIPVTFEGQRQNGNNKTDHLVAFDFMATAPVEPESNGNIAFNFQHLATILIIDINVPKQSEYTSLELSCDDAEFTTAGYVDITSDQPVIVPTETSHTIELELDDFETTEANQHVILNLMIAPVDLSGHRIKLKISGPHANFTTHFDRGENKPFLPGYAYKPSIGDLEGGDIVMLEPGPDFNIAIKSLANGEDYLLEKTDFKIRHIEFKSSVSGTPSGNYVQVESQDSPSPIYASWNPETQTITVTSAGASISSNIDASCMFANLRNLKDIDFTNFSTDICETMENTFMNCNSIQSIDLSGLNTSNVRRFYGTFSYCENLIEAPTISIPSVCGSIAYMFEGCEKLVSVSAGGWDVSNVRDMQGLFSDCKSLASLDLSSLVTSGCERFDWMFYGCEKLKSLDLRNFDFRYAELTENMFTLCTSLKTILLSDVSSERMARTGSMFSRCISLETLSYDSMYFPNANDVSGMFSDCSKLTSIDVTNLVTSNAVSIGGIFSGCSSLESIDVSSWNTSGATDVGGMFSGCASLTSINISNFTTANVENFADMFSGCESLSSLTVCPDLVTSKAQNVSGMFNGCKSLASISVDDWDTSNVQQFQYLFGNCSSVSSFDLSNLSTGKATDLSAMFLGCTGISSIDLSSFVTENVEKIDGMFSGCSNLKKILWGDNFVTSKVHYMSGLFDSCSSLQSIDLSCFDTSVSVSFAFFFNNCSSLKTIIWPVPDGDFHGFDTHYAEDFRAMFNGCSSIESLDLSFFNTINALTMESMFYGCEALESLDVSSFNVENTNNMNAMFEYTNNLNTIDFGPNFRIKGSPGYWFWSDACSASDTVSITCSQDMKDDMINLAPDIFLEMLTDKYVWTIL